MRYRWPREGRFVGCSFAAMSREPEIMESQVVWEPDTKRNTHMDRFRAAVASSCGLRLGERRAGGEALGPDSGRGGCLSVHTLVRGRGARILPDDSGGLKRPGQPIMGHGVMDTNSDRGGSN